MLSIFIFLGIATTFARKAYDKNRNRYVWGTIGVVSYFVLQLFAGSLLAVTKPEWLENQAMVTVIGLVTGFAGVGVAYYILNKLPDPTEVEAENSGLLDDFS
jgi:protein-S-isoprenylcysteine O-methyltransferase Ste14